ncbi:hypothetical protein Agub_g204, partial [Astrephomene gubernaculifera]
ERVRQMGEACDSLAGFQVFADDLTGFGALAAAVLSEVAEEYGSRPRVLFSLRQPGQGQGGRGGSAAAAAREDLSEALALTRMTELVSLYVPLAVPADRTALPYLSYNPWLPFHSSAILASAIDTALLPTRLAGVRSALGEPLGASDLHSLTRLLRPVGHPGANLAALHLALPCPSLPADLQQLQQQLDQRIRPPHAHAAVTAAAAAGTTAGGSGGGSSWAGLTSPAALSQALHGSTAQLSLDGGLASLTPGISGREDAARGSSWAESYCLRGGRTDAGPASTSSALQALDALLLRHPHRMCVRHRCAAPLPLPVPLPFPSIFSPRVSLHGDVMLRPTTFSPGAAAAATSAAAAASSHTPGAASSGVVARAAGQGVHSVPVLTRMHATREFEGWVAGVHGRWGRAAGGSAGRAVLDAWGLGTDDAAEVGAALQEVVTALGEEEEV